MHPAPSVNVRVGDRGAWAVAVVMASVTSAVVCAVWLAELAADVSPWLLSVAAIGAVAAFCVALGACRVPLAALRWDQQAWRARPHGDGAPVEGRLAVALDFGSWMLVRFDVDGDVDGALGPWRGSVGHGVWRRQRCWLPLSRAVVGGDWHALRCAVHARPPGAALPPV